MRSFLYLCGWLCLAFGPGAGQGRAQAVMSKTDSINLGLKYLLEDRRTRYETTDAINALYNSDFNKADLEFRYLEVKYPNHPLPTFLIGLMEWWKIVPNEEDKSHDSRFLFLMDETIKKAEKLMARNGDNLEAAFFLAGAYGFRGRLNGDRHNWRKATFDGKAALKYLEMSRGKEQYSVEFLFGDGLFSYYREYISDNYPLLRPVLTFFPRGDKAKGLDQLQICSRNAFYTRTEAQTYMVRIYANEEGQPEKAYPLAQYLARTFPNNAYFARLYARTCFATGRTSEARDIAADIYKKTADGMAGYEANTLRHACYYLGYADYTNGTDTASKKRALRYFSETVAAAEKCNQMESGYTLYAMYYAGRLSQDLGQQDQARTWMQRCVDNAPKNEGAHKDAQAWLDKNAPKRNKFLGIF